MRFPPSFIERLRSHLLVSEVIGKRITIKKHGREFHALCPFHNEKTPSFTINDDKGFFHCFGCGAHGDTIEFIKLYERLTYPEAIEALARESGLALPEISREDSKRFEQEKTLLGVIEAATQWFETMLLSPRGALARDYIEKRGIKPETLRQFRIGYAPDDREGLHKHLTSAGFSKILQAEAGLIIVPEDGSPAYDRFRGRVMFPIRNASGKIIAFGGRLIGIGSTNKHLPKYLNSPETPLFKKGEMLFNLDLAKRPAREGNITVVMEGYMDVVSTAQSGISYAVATLGTAVTPEHLRLIWQLAKEPVMCLDGDAAGKRAMMRAAEVALPLLKPGYSLRFAILPKGEDPDSYVQKNGKASFERILMASRRLSQTLWDELVPQFRTDLPEGRAALEAACKKLADRIEDQTVRQHYASYFKKQLWDRPPAPAANGKNGKPGAKKAPEQKRSHLIEHMIVAHHSAPLEKLTRQLIDTLLRFPGLLHKSHVEETLSHLDISNPRLDALRNVLVAAAHHTEVHDRVTITAFIQSQLPGESIDDLVGDMIRLPYRDTLTADDALMLWNETITSYEITHLQAELAALQASVGQVMDEAAYLRQIELQQAIQQKTASRRFAPAEPDAA